MSSISSKQRYEEYLGEVRERRSDSKKSDGSPAKEGKQRGFWQLLSLFWRQIGEHKGKVLFALGTLTFSTLLGLVPPAGTKFAIDYVLTSPPLEMPAWLSNLLPEGTSRMGLLWYISAFVVGVTILKTAVHLWGRWFATKAVNLVGANIRRRVFEHAMRLPLNRIQDLKSGGTTSLIREDAGGIADLIFNMLYNPWQAIIQLVGSLIVLIFVDWRLMIGGLLLLPAVWVTHRTWIRRVRPLYKDIRSRRQGIDASTTETFGGIRIVRTFARDRTESSRFTRGTHLLARQQLMVWWSTRIIEVIWEVLIPLASTGLLLYGGWQILNQDLTLGDLMMFLVYLTMLLGPIASIASSAMSFQNNLAGLDRVLDLLEEETEDARSDGQIELNRQSVGGAIEFESVSFHYPGSTQHVLRDVSFTAPAGCTIALVGRSGAGKTTLCNLVARFFDPTSGRILIDGKSIDDVDLHSYRRLLGVVEQDVFLFDGTIRDNIAYGRRGATDEEIVAAAKAAAAYDFVMGMPKGLDTWIGERGVKLSGGQRQRLAIARAILADPRILILDEATSNLDSESERLIQQSLRELLENRTAFVIAHRLSTIAHADLILVLEDGQIVEQGTHQQLLAEGGIYQKMVLLQTTNPNTEPQAVQ